MTVAHESPQAFGAFWSPLLHDASVVFRMSNLIRVIAAASRDAQRAEALVADPAARRALRDDPDGALLAFELRAGAIGDEAGERKSRIVRRERGVGRAQQDAATS